MAKDEIVVPVSMQELKLSVKMPKALNARIWIAKQLLRAAALVIGCGIQIDMVDADKSKESK